MKKCVNGEYIEMTADEIAALQQLETVPAEKTVEERLAALEALLADRGGA